MATMRKRAAEFAVSASKNSRHETSDFSSQRLHDYYLSNLQNYPSEGNAQTADNLGHLDATNPAPVPLY
jgi:hypothetical protein